MRRETGNDAPTRISHWWALTADELLAVIDSRRVGLTTGEASDRLASAPRPLGRQMSGDVELAIRQFRSPILLILMVAALVSEVLGERVDAVIIAAIVLVSGVLGFVQERGAVRAVHELMTSVQVHCRVLRDGRPIELRVEEIVRGDIVVIRAGDIIPGDGVVLESNALHVDESALTGESYPRRKQPGAAGADSPLVDRDNSVHLGTHVVSGEGTVVVVETGTSTEFGAVVGHVAARHVPTSFERGVTAFGMLLLRWTAVLVFAVFTANLVLSRPFMESLLFSLALAVGLTPQMLPAIVTLSLSKGANQMAHRRVIVKRLEAIEDIGGIDVLCTDKTGTLTVGAVALDRVEDVDGVESANAARFAWLNARLQSGFPNPIDAAILDSVPAPMDHAERLFEIPYDFERKRLSVVARLADGNWMITKGAVEKVIDCCVTASGRPLAGELERIRTRVAVLSERGMRVMAIAVRRLDDVEVGGHGGTMSESSLDLVGLLAFMDPPKPGVDAAIRRLAGLNVDTRLVTGDHRLAARHISDRVGIVSENILTGREIESMDDPTLVEAAREVRVFAEVTPVDKERIVRALASAGHAVAFLGDGINDAPALHAADVGISVDTAVDAAKDAADIVLLDKELSVISDGVESGRRIFANTLKYVYVTTSANFGNMLSMAAAALFLPFLPLLPSQILLLNFLSDIPGTTIATDRVDEEQLSTPRRWDIHAVRSFMIVFGLTSAVFDILTFVVLRAVVDAGPVDFRSGWFIESTITELAAMLVLRTSRPFHRSRPSTALVVSSAIVLVVTVLIPFSWIAEPLGMGPPTATTLLALLAITVGYVLATEVAKHRLPRLLGAFG